MARYYRANKDKWRESSERNRETMNARRREKYAADAEHREQRKAEMRAHRAANVDRYREHDMKRKRRSVYWQAKIRCVRCGYDTTRNALQWHHVDPSTKSVNPSELRYSPTESQIAELLHCVCICANCHWEVEAGLWEVTDEHRRVSDSFVHGAVARDDV